AVHDADGPDLVLAEGQLLDTHTVPQPVHRGTAARVDPVRRGTVAVAAGPAVGHRGAVAVGPGLVGAGTLVDRDPYEDGDERHHDPAPGGGEAADRQTAALLPALLDLDESDDAEDDREHPGDEAQRREDAEDQGGDRERVRRRRQAAVRV